MAIRLILSLLLGFGMVSPAVAENSAVCANPDAAVPGAEVAEDFEVLVAQISAGRTTYCETCPSLSKLQNYARNSSSNEACIRGLKKFACDVSPWKGLNIAERYDRFMKLAESVSTPFPKSVLACIAARETLYLDPVSISCSTYREPGTSTGFGHITRSTFEDLFGVDWRTQTDMMAQVRKAEWLSPYNLDRPTPTPAMIFASHYPRDPRLQIEAMARVLAAKGNLRSGATPKQARAVLRTAVTNYNGSSTKKTYATQVQACLACLESGGSPVACLDKASSADYGKTGEICD